MDAAQLRRQHESSERSDADRVGEVIQSRGGTPARAGRYPGWRTDGPPVRYHESDGAESAVGARCKRSVAYRNDVRLLCVSEQRYSDASTHDPQGVQPRRNIARRVEEFEFEGDERVC